VSGDQRDFFRGVERDYWVPTPGSDVEAIGFGGALEAAPGGTLYAVARKGG
jgi:hypothetical protein